MSFPQLQILTVDIGVTLAGSVATFTYNGQSSLTVDVPADSLLLLQLGLDPACGVRFVTNPCDWFSGTPQQPTPTPPSFAVHRAADTLCSILDFNPPGQLSTETFLFTLSVQLGSKVYTSPDPTIINHKPE